MKIIMTMIIPAIIVDGKKSVTDGTQQVVQFSMTIGELRIMTRGMCRRIR